MGFLQLLKHPENLMKQRCERQLVQIHQLFTHQVVLHSHLLLPTVILRLLCTQTLPSTAQIIHLHTAPAITATIHIIHLTLMYHLHQHQVTIFRLHRLRTTVTIPIIQTIKDTTPWTLIKLHQRIHIHQRLILMPMYSQHHLILLHHRITVSGIIIHKEVEFLFKHVSDRTSWDKLRYRKEKLLNQFVFFSVMLILKKIVFSRCFQY